MSITFALLDNQLPHQNSNPTIMAIQPVVKCTMGQRKGFSSTDLLKINKLYKCSNGEAGTPVPEAVTQCVDTHR